MPSYLRNRRSISPALRHYERQFIAKGCTEDKARELARRKFARKGWPKIAGAGWGGEG